MQFQIPLTIGRFLIPLLCTGLLAGGVALFLYMHIRTRERLYGAMAVLGLCSFTLVFGEAMVLLIGGWLHSPGTGMQFHRIEHLGGASFLWSIPLVMRSILTMTPRAQRVNMIVIRVMFLLALGLTIAALVAPDLFVSITVHKSSWLVNEGDYGRGKEGILLYCRDALLAAVVIYLLASLVRDLRMHRRYRYLGPILAGTLIAIWGGIDDILHIHTNRHVGLFPDQDYARFALGITIFTLIAMGSMIRRFLDLAMETERARELATREVVWRKRTEEEREKLREQLFQSQKMEAIGILAGGVAHDFNNILTSIMGNASMLALQLSADNPCRTCVNDIMDSSERAAGLTQQLLTFSRKRIVPLKPVDLNALVRNLERFLIQLVGTETGIFFALMPGEITIVGDGSQLEQVIMNLVTNARDAMSDGGVITIGTGLRNAADLPSGIDCENPVGEFAYVAVSDTGTGMDDETQQRIFEPFFTTKEVGRGTGLGLAIVFSIVKQHRGSIVVDSEPEKGTTFTVYFPRS